MANKRTILMFICILPFCVFAQEMKEAKADLYKSSKEFVNEIDSIIARQRTIKKMELEEELEGKVENIEVLEGSNRKLSIKSFEKYLNDYPNSQYVPDVLYRLGTLYFEEASQKLIRETESYEKEYQKFIRGEAQVLPPEPNIDYSSTIRVLNTLVEKHKDYRFRDDALYLLGYSYFEEGQMDKAVKIFSQIVDEFPRSDRLPEIYTRLGENYFDLDNFDKAVYYYSRVLEYPDSVYYENVLYKLGWIYYSRGNINEAADFFVTLIDNNERKYGQEYTSTFKTEAKNYIAIGFSERDNGIKEAHSFFRNIGGRHYEYEIMSKMCDLYIRSDRVKESKDSVAFVLSKYPYHPDNPVLQDKLINDLRRFDNYSGMNQEREKMISLFGEGSVWREKNKDNPKAIITADSLIEKQLISVALYHQERGDRTGKRSEYITAARLYYDFLKKYPSDPLMVGARYNYAQVLFNLGDYDGAINEYTAVQRYTTEEQYREKSSFGVVASFQAKLKIKDTKYHVKELRPLFKDKGEVLPPQKMSPDEGAFISAVKKYEELNPSGRRLDEVYYMGAEVYFRNNMFDEAISEYKKVVDRYPDSRFYGDSIRNLIALYNYKKDYKEVEYWSNKLLTSKKVSSSSYDSKEIKSLITGSVFKSAQRLESEGKDIAAADEYVRLARQYPRSEYSDAALYNAGVIYEKAGRYKDASSIYNIMLNRYPRSKYAVDAMFRLAISYEQDLNFTKAVYYYDLITKKYPASKYSPDSHYNAYRIRRANYEYERAASHLLAYSTTRKSLREKADAVMQAAWLYEKNGKPKKAMDLYSSYAAKNRTDLDGCMEAYVEMGKLLEKANKADQAIDSYKKAISMFKSSGSPAGTSAANYNSEAVFRSMNKGFYDYSSVKVGKYEYTSVKTSYDKKEKMLDELTNSYLNIVKMGTPEWSLASLYMIGLSFEKFSEFLYSIPKPAEINTEELRREYNEQIKVQATPYDEKAVEYYEKVLAESARLKTVNVWTSYAEDRLSDLRPDSYSRNKQEIYVNSPSVDIVDYGFVGQ